MKEPCCIFLAICLLVAMPLQLKAAKYRVPQGSAILAIIAQELRLTTQIAGDSSVRTGGDEFPLKKLMPLTYVVDYEPFWSPDGRQIVLISNRHGGMKVHTMDANSEDHGSNMRQLTPFEAEDDSPAWSPDGRRIAFVSVRGGVSQIFVMKANGTDIRQVTSGASQNIHPVWSPDSSRILFNTTHFAVTGQVTDTSAAAANRVIGDETDDGMDLATMRADGTDLQRLTNRAGHRDASYTYVSFTPDGKSIVHRRLQGEVSQIFVMNSDGSNGHNVSGASPLDGWPAWSPDGKRIVFARRVQDAFQIFVMNRDGSEGRQLTDALGGGPKMVGLKSKVVAGRNQNTV